MSSADDAYDNALAETTIGLYQTQRGSPGTQSAYATGSPFRTGPITGLADIEEIISAWVAWYNHDRLMHQAGPAPTRRGRGGLLQPASRTSFVT